MLPSLPSLIQSEPPWIRWRRSYVAGRFRSSPISVWQVAGPGRAAPQGFLLPLGGAVRLDDGWLVANERSKRAGSAFRLRPAELTDELDATRRERERDRLLEEQPAEPPHHRTLGPRIISFRVEDNERERLLERQAAHLAGGEFGVDDAASLNRAFESGCGCSLRRHERMFASNTHYRFAMPDTTYRLIDTDGSELE